MALASTGCVGFAPTKSRHTVRIESDPPGAWISRIDEKGKQAIGQTPLETEVTVVESRYESSPGLWITTGVLGVAAGGLTYLTFSSDDSMTQGLAGAGALTAGLLLMMTLPLAIVSQSSAGDLAWRGFEGSPPTFEATMAGHSSASAILDAGDEALAKPVFLRLAPSGDVGVLATMGESNVFGVGGLGVVGGAAEAAERPVMAVFQLEDRSKKLAAETLDQLTDYVAARVTETGHFRVVPRSELRARLAESKADSFRTCVDESCQIQLGKAVAAQKSLSTRMIRAGATCALTMTLYDLLTEATETAATVRTDCTEQALMDGIDQLTTRLAPKP
ncbi:hypothetical protein L6R52_01670 [Myxococcota bacterium]|nr:hypothetical protein [Myxococcota bacterium]